MCFARQDAGTPYWYLTDHLGSIRDVIDSSAVVKDSITYDGFGNITAETDSNYRGRYAWTGREIDQEIQLQYNRARYYDAGTGRWLSQDPLGFDAGDGNLYRYVHNSPPSFLDPSGQVTQTLYPAPVPVVKNVNNLPSALHYHVGGSGWLGVEKHTLWNVEAAPPPGYHKTDVTIPVMVYEETAKAPYYGNVHVTEFSVSSIFSLYLVNTTYLRVSVTKYRDYQPYLVTFREYASNNSWWIPALFTTYVRVPEDVVVLNVIKWPMAKYHQDYEICVGLSDEAKEAIVEQAKKVLIGPE